MLTPSPAAEPLMSAPAPTGAWDVHNTAGPAPAGAIPAHASSPPVPASVDNSEPVPQPSRRRGRHAAHRARVHPAAPSALASPDGHDPAGAAPKRTSAKRLLAIALGAAVLAGGYLAYTAFFDQGDDEVAPAPPPVTTATDTPSHLGTGLSASPSPAGSAAPSAVKTTSPASRPVSITLPERIGQLKRQTGAVAASQEAAALKSIHRSMPAARDAVLGQYGDPPAPAVVLVYRVGKGAPIPAPAKATRYPGGRQGGIVACMQASTGHSSQCTWVDSRTVGTILLSRTTQSQALALLQDLRDSVES